MSELTAEKRAELRRLAEAAKVATDGAFVMSNDDMDTAGQAYEALHGALCWRTVLSLLDALDATESKLVAAWTDCKTLTINHLRAELAAAHAKPSPELTAVEVAERAKAWDDGWTSGYALGLGSKNDGGLAYDSYGRHTNPHARAKAGR